MERWFLTAVSVVLGLFLLLASVIFVVLAMVTLVYLWELL